MESNAILEFSQDDCDDWGHVIKIGQMKYTYSTLRVMVYHDKYFPIDQLREAVEYLKTQPQTEHTGLMARTLTTAGDYKLLAEPILPLDKILGMTPREVWAEFDAAVDRSRKSLEARTSWTGV